MSSTPSLTSNTSPEEFQLKQGRLKTAKVTNGCLKFSSSENTTLNKKKVLKVYAK
jgi:hypothetical protein